MGVMVAVGKKPEERELRRQGAEVLARLRADRPSVRLSKPEIRRLTAQLGLGVEDVEELEALEAGGGG